MKTRTMLWIGMAAILCLASFWLGRLSRPLPTYDMNPLAIDKGLLQALRAGYTTNAIEKLEVLLDNKVYDAMSHRPAVQGRDREILDRILTGVARYREQYPRHIETINDYKTLYSDPYMLQQYEGWINERKQIDAFLHNFAKQ